MVQFTEERHDRPADSLLRLVAEARILRFVDAVPEREFDADPQPVGRRQGVPVVLFGGVLIRLLGAEGGRAETHDERDRRPIEVRDPRTTILRRAQDHLDLSAGMPFQRHRRRRGAEGPRILSRFADEWFIARADASGYGPVSLLAGGQASNVAGGAVIRSSSWARSREPVGVRSNTFTRRSPADGRRRTKPRDSSRSTSPVIFDASQARVSAS